MAAHWTLPAEVDGWIKRMAAVLHQASSWRLAPLLVGLLFAKGRKTIASWLRGGGLSADYQDGPTNAFCNRPSRNWKWHAARPGRIVDSRVS